MISPRDSVGVQVADTLPQTFHEACVPKDTLAAVDLQAVSETVTDRKSTRLNSSHEWISRMPSSA